MKSKSLATKFLQDNFICTLSTVGKEGSPYSAPMYYVIDENLNLYFATREDTKKYKNLINISKVSITVIHNRKDSALQIKGVASAVKEIAKIEEIIKKLSELSKFKNVIWPHPSSRLDALGDYKIFEVAPSWMRLVDFSKAVGDRGESYFTQIV